MAEEPENRIDDGLLGKYLAGETDAAESERVRHWLAQHNSERQEFDRFERIWEASGKLGQSAPVDTDAAWNKMKGKMRATSRPDEERTPDLFAPSPSPQNNPDRDEAVVKPLPVDPHRTVPHWTVPLRTANHRPLWKVYWRVAAAVVLLFGVFWFTRRETKPTPVAEVAVASVDQKIERILPDGSKVLLNKNSRIRYPATFAADSREVTLVGEAFFEVTPDPAKPFRIHARNTTVQVLGTSFGVRAYDANVSVTVRTGKVKFTAKNKAITLVKDEQAAFNARRDTILKAPKLDANALAFKTGVLTFEGEPLSQAIRKINEAYQTNVQLGNERLNNCPITITFDVAHESLDQVLKVTEEAMNLRSRRENGRIVLDGKPCQ